MSASWRRNRQFILHCFRPLLRSHGSVDSKVSVSIEFQFLNNSLIIFYLLRTISEHLCVGKKAKKKMPISEILPLMNHGLASLLFISRFILQIMGYSFHPGETLHWLPLQLSCLYTFTLLLWCICFSSHFLSSSIPKIYFCMAWILENCMLPSLFLFISFFPGILLSFYLSVSSEYICIYDRRSSLNRFCRQWFYFRALMIDFFIVGGQLKSQSVLTKSEIICFGHLKFFFFIILQLFFLSSFPFLAISLCHSDCVGSLPRTFDL